MSPEGGEDDFAAATASASEELALWDCTGRCSGIDTFIIDGTIPSGIINRMLYSIRSLKTFIFDGAVYLEQDPDWYASLSRALKHHGQSVKYIALSNIHHEDGILGSSAHSQLEIGEALPTLTTFYGPLTSLLNLEDMNDRRHLEAMSAILPATIEDLLLEVPGDWDPEDLVDLSAQFPHGCFPCLKRLYISFCLITLDAMPLELITLRKYFARTRIAFSFRLDYWDLADTPETIAEAKERTRALGPEGAELVDTTFAITCAEGKPWSVVSHEM